MRRWAAPCFPLPREPFGLAAVLLALSLLPGCVTRGTHQKVVDQSARRATRIEQLEASSEALSKERVDLIDEIEDLRLRREELEGKVEALEQERAELETNLRESESQLVRNTAEVEQLRETYGGLVADLESEVTAGRIEIDRLREGLRLNLSQEILFRSGSARLNVGGREVIRKVAERLVGVPQRIEVQGHTDDVGIQGSLARRYPTNWELAGARAASVVRLLGEYGVSPDRLSAVSFGEFQPVASNDSAAGRARNRRIEIRLVPVETAAPVPDSPVSDPPVPDSPATE
jgi:chemotaxis protein MotB